MSSLAFIVCQRKVEKKKVALHHKNFENKIKMYILKEILEMWLKLKMKQFFLEKC